MDIGLFNTLAGPPLVSIPAGTTMAQTSGYSAIGVGFANYAYDPTLTAAYVGLNPRTAFQSFDGRIWKLAETEPDVTVFGVVLSSSIPPAPAVQLNNSQAMQAAFDSGLPLKLPNGFIWCDPAKQLYLYKPGENGISKITGAGSLDSVIGFNCDDTITRPCLTVPEFYVDGFDDKMYYSTGLVCPASPAYPPSGRNRQWSNFQITTGLGRYATAVFITGHVGCCLEDIQYSSAHRGELNPLSFNTTYRDMKLVGKYYVNPSRTLAEIESDYRKSFMLCVHNHSNIYQVSGSGAGTLIQLSGAGTSLIGARLEVSECALALGGKSYSWFDWNGTDYGGAGMVFQGRVNDITSESCRWGIISERATRAAIANVVLTGSATAVPRTRAPAAGLLILSQTSADTTFTNINVGMVPKTSLYGDVINFSAAQIVNGVGLGAQGINSVFSATANGPGYIRNEMPNTAANATSAPERQRVSIDTQTQMVGLTGINLRDPLVFARNLGGTVSVLSGATSATVTFVASKTAGSASFAVAPNAVTDASSTLPAGKYYYATTLVSKRGETGVTDFIPFNTPTTVNSAVYKSVIVAAGQRASMTFSAATPVGAYKRRVYRGSAPGIFDRFFELPGSATSFSDIGQASTGTDQPPMGSGTTADMREFDANYLITGIETPWPTTVGVSGKATTGFTLTFGTPAPADAMVGWLLARP